MYRKEPPPLATWILEHLATGERDEALSGDLLEHYRAGRTDGWYWCQVLTACASSWSKSLAVRGPVLLFALLWSALAPVWEAAINNIKPVPRQNSFRDQIARSLNRDGEQIDWFFQVRTCRG